ncbi:MAG: ribosomal protein [Deltaproteobacteria bacterium]|nr:ribosomal protein [Deltaproteobacteria bacterium]
MTLDHEVPIGAAAPIYWAKERSRAIGKQSPHRAGIRWERRRNQAGASMPRLIQQSRREAVSSPTSGGNRPARLTGLRRISRGIHPPDSPVPAAPCACAHWEKLDVYRLAIDFVAWSFAMCQRPSTAHRHTRDQLLRSSQSVPQNIAAGNGKRSLADRQRLQAPLS